MKAGLWAFIFCLLLLSATVRAGSFIDSDQVDFDQGTYSQTTTDGNTIIMNKTVNDTFFASGTYLSREFDASHIVNWKNMTWTAFLDSFGTVKVQRRFKSSAGGNWSAWTSAQTSVQGSNSKIFSINARYAQYRANFTVANISQTVSPHLDDIILSYGPLKPNVTLNEPENGYTSLTGLVTFECSASSLNGLTTIKLYWNYTGTWGVGETASVNGTNASAVFEKNLTNSSFVWNCMATDSAAQSAFAASNRSVGVTITVTETNPPNLTYSIFPKTVITGGNVEISANATDDTGVDSVWAVITKPDTTQERLELVNNGTVTYAASQSGTYGVIIRANDTGNNIVSKNDSFFAGNFINFSVQVVDRNSLGTSAMLKVFYTGTENEVDTWQSADGIFAQKSIVDGVYDLKFSAYNGKLVALYQGMSLSQNQNKAVMMEEYMEPVDGQIVTYGVDNPFTTTGTTVRVGYDSAIADESLSVHVCEAFDIVSKACFGTWEPRPNATQNTDEDYFEIVMTDMVSLGVGLKQAGYCGDGVCGEGENSTVCPSDCVCEEGETRSCGTSDIPPCQLGTQTCMNGSWGACQGSIEPTPETCNRLDDNCDGIVDNINNGTSLAGTRCQCYNNADPLENETCNNIDDDCDGTIDEGLQRRCGTNVGICDFGTQNCVQGVWGTCEGGIMPEPNDICFNDLDDDCDGQTDEGCGPMAPGAGAGDGEFPWLIIIAILGGGIVVLLLLRKKPKTEWEELERKYGA